jgi:hypothetical protein
MEQTLPHSFYYAVAVLLFLSSEALLKWRRLSYMFSLVSYFTVFLWYIWDVSYSAERYADMPAEDIDACFWQVLVFLIAFRVLMAVLRKYDREVTGVTAEMVTAQLPARQLVMQVIVLWSALFFCGLIRMKGNLWGALFPLQGRWGDHMWARAGVGGAWDWLISSGGYLYMFVCGLMGLLLVLLRSSASSGQLVVLILISWPYFFLLGSRHKLLAVVCPALFAFLLVGRGSMLKKVMGAVVAFAVLNYAMMAMLQFRQSGFEEFINHPFGSVDVERKHEGLNMIQELAYINGFYRTGQLTPEYGGEYVAQVLNAVPRAIWANKPTLSFGYSVLRGHGDEKGGVTATISTGLIGQGVVNFGELAGPIIAAFLLALYGFFLMRHWPNGGHPLRFFVFIMGIALVPNLGREFTLLVLWPVVFGSLVLWMMEHYLPLAKAGGVLASMAVPWVRAAGERTGPRDFGKQSSTRKKIRTSNRRSKYDEPNEH